MICHWVVIDDKQMQNKGPEYGLLGIFEKHIEAIGYIQNVMGPGNMTEEKVDCTAPYKTVVDNRYLIILVPHQPET